MAPYRWQLAPKNGSHSWYHSIMSARRGWHQDAIYFDHDAPCQDSERHRHCKGRWRGSVSLGYSPDGEPIRHAEAGDLVARNVATLVETPKGQSGRPSNSLPLRQASALLAAAEGTRMHAYISLCLATGIRTEEARALRWEHVTFGDPAAQPPVPASAAVWRSVRSHGDTKTEKSRRTLALPQMAADALRAHKEQQAAGPRGAR